MRIETNRKLFIGMKLDNKMREQLERCPTRDRAFFDGTDGRYLMMLHDNGTDSYIGKLLDGPTPSTALEDLRRNILSIMNRICPGRHSQDDVKVYATDEAEGVAPPSKKKVREEDSGGYSGGGRGYY